MYSIRLSKVLAAPFVAASLVVSVSADARPADPTWRPSAKPEAAEQTCGPILERVSYGRGGYVVVGSRGTCTEGRKIERWAGPRDTIPIYQ